MPNPTTIIVVNWDRRVMLQDEETHEVSGYPKISVFSSEESRYTLTEQDQIEFARLISRVTGKGE